MQETGLTSASAITTSAISYFRPKMVAMLGMCCGINSPKSTTKIGLGDVCIMKETVCWDEGRYTQDPRDEKSDFFEVRSKPGYPTHKIKPVIEKIFENKKKNIEEKLLRTYNQKKVNAGINPDQIPRSPKILYETNVSGSSVVASEKQIQQVIERVPSAKSLEMEAHAIYKAATVSPGVTPEVICIKGVADFGNGKKNKEFQTLASIGSLKVLLELLSDIIGNHKNNFFR